MVSYLAVLGIRETYRELWAHDITGSWAYALMAPWEALNRIRIDHFKIRYLRVLKEYVTGGVSELVK